jgi:hypothetical protein
MNPKSLRHFGVPVRDEDPAAAVVHPFPPLIRDGIYIHVPNAFAARQRVPAKPAVFILEER